MNEEVEDEKLRVKHSPWLILDQSCENEEAAWSVL